MVQRGRGVSLSLSSLGIKRCLKQRTLENYARYNAHPNLFNLSFNKMLMAFHPRNQANKETLAKTANDISESLISLTRTMAEQVKQSGSNLTTLG